MSYFSIRPPASSGASKKFVSKFVSNSRNRLFREVVFGDFSPSVQCFHTVILAVQIHRSDGSYSPHVTVRICRQ